MWTESKITDLLKPETNPEYAKAVSRAIVAIYNRQTLEEKQCDNTISANGIGFSSSDAKIGTYMAKYVIKEEKVLSGKFLVTAQKMAIKYRRQLTEIANKS